MASGRSTVNLLLPACVSAMGTVLLSGGFPRVRSAQNKKKSLSGHSLEFAECVENDCGVFVGLWQRCGSGFGCYEQRLSTNG